MPEDYKRHQSPELNALFANQRFPHQGQEPDLASVIFIGLDANYSSEISTAPRFFPCILEYQKDGIRFWKKYGTHHPFLLAEYPLKRNTGGVPYHKNFAKMGLDSSFADKISFIELLPCPTTGRTDESVFWSLFDRDHAVKIDALIAGGEHRLIILSSSVMRNMKKAAKRNDVFRWLPKTFKTGEMKRIGKTVIWGAPHFSSAITNEALLALGDHIRKFSQEV